MSNYAPILIITLNRYEHFRRCVESLAACTLAEKTDLYIALDYPLSESHWEGYRKIEGFLGTIKGFNTVNIIKRTENFGAEKNEFEANSQIFKKYDRLIYSEDDNEFSRDFLSFINKGLDIFKNREDIFSICGYNYPIEIPKSYKKDIYVWTGFSGWGFGIWKEKYMNVDLNYSELKPFLENKQNIKKLNSIAEIYVSGLKRILDTGHVTGDTLICYHLIINKMYCIFPIVSRVRNTGHDGTGIHCENMEADSYRKQLIHEGNCNYEMPFDIKPEREINNVLYNHFKISIYKKIKSYFKQVLISLSH